ncbi:hypothetical protein Tco_1022982 [Tanacetum coccineum]
MSFNFNLYHDGVFHIKQLEYVNFDCSVINDVDFDDMIYMDFFHTIRRLLLINPIRMHYKNPVTPLFALKLLKIEANEVHSKTCLSDSDSDVDTNNPLDDVAHITDFEHKNEGNVDISRMATHDPWLNKLVGTSNFISQTKNIIPNLPVSFILEVDDPDDD